ncbi:MAG: serine/threonine-protein kinase [Candidatus Acidiferrales bacterium]
MWARGNTSGTTLLNDATARSAPKYNFSQGQLSGFSSRYICAPGESPRQAIAVLPFEHSGSLNLTKLGKYELIRELGRGAMGVVFQARDPLIGRLVALKTITAGVAENPDLRERFYREAQAAGNMQHPNVVTIYDLGEADAIPYIAMEYLEGESLEKLISRRSPLPLAQKLGFVVQTCRALDYAHRRGIVHRDIKPANIMVTVEGVVKVVDFGIARLVDTSKTQTGTLLGTLAYMSPQQIRGKHADERSDIWAMGVVMYELLSYQRPFSDENHAAVLLSIIGDEPPPINTVAADCPTELAAVVQKALRKDDAERYQSMEQVLLELEPIWSSLQRDAVSRMLGQSQQFIQSGNMAEARDLLRQCLQIDTSNLTAKSRLDEVNAALEGGAGRSKLRESVTKGESLLAEGLFLEARRQAEAALQLGPHDSAARRLLGRVELREQQARLEHAPVTTPAPAEKRNEYVLQTVAQPTVRLSLVEGNVGNVPTVMQPRSSQLSAPGSDARAAKAEVTPPRKAEIVSATQRAKTTPFAPAVSPKVSPKPRWKSGVVYVIVGLILFTIGGKALRRFAASRHQVVSATPAPTAAPPVASQQPDTTPQPSPQAPSQAVAPSLEDQQRHLIDLAHEAADKNDLKMAQNRLDQAEKLDGPLNPLIKNLRRQFTQEEQSEETRKITKQESSLWNQATDQMNQGSLDQAERYFRNILALPEGGRRRADAERYLNDVIPARRQEDQLWAQAQQTWQSQQPGRARKAIALLDQIMEGSGPRVQQAQQWRTVLFQWVAKNEAKAQNKPQPIAAAAEERMRFSLLEDQFRAGTQRGDSTGEEQLRGLRPQFRAIADGGGPFATEAKDYINNVIPNAIKQMENHMANASAAVTDAAQFNDAVEHFKKAVAASDAKALRKQVLPEFQALAQGTGPNAAESSRYVNSLIPGALREITARSKP